jgi:hypothetical protein
MVAASETAQSGSYQTEHNGRQYRARWAQLGSIEQLRVNVRVTVGADNAAFHVETLDLYSPRSRRMFANRAARLCGCGIDDIDSDLSELLVAVDKTQRASLEAVAATPKTEVPKMSDDERAEALALLRDPNLMDRVATDMEALGYVGEDSNKKLGYLIAVSRKLDEPLSAIIVSQSGAGKSGLTSILERIMPAEEVVFWSRLTPQALYYVDKDFLRRKLVLIEEREGSEAADYSIRALQSKHKLVQAVPVKDPTTGAIKTKTMEVEGPAAFIETTTRLSINPENASRCFELYLDESLHQTERVQSAQRTAKTPKGLMRKETCRALELVHQNAQRLLEPLSVAIPYAELLTFPAAWLRTRRDNLRLLNLIEAVAFLHQHQRKRCHLDAGGNYIEANVEDYAVAYALAASVFGSGFDELKKPARDLLALIEGKVAELAKARGAQSATVTFSRRDVRLWSGLPNHQVKLAMRELEDLELVEVERSQRGSRHSYRLVVEAQVKRATLTGLLTPVELYNRLSQDSGAPQQKSRGKVEQSGKPPVSTTFSTKNRAPALA